MRPLQIGPKGVKCFFQEYHALWCIAAGVLSRVTQELLCYSSNLYRFPSQFCYTTADLAIPCAQFESMEILNDLFVYLFLIRIRPAAPNLSVIRSFAKKVW